MKRPSTNPRVRRLRAPAGFIGVPRKPLPEGEAGKQAMADARFLGERKSFFRPIEKRDMNRSLKQEWIDEFNARRGKIGNWVMTVTGRDGTHYFLTYNPSIKEVVWASNNRGRYGSIDDRKNT
jgi:hypothetical protein